MKKVIKVLISLLLVFAILFSMAWYLFEYDPDFTRDFLLRQAHKFEEKGRNSVAVWLYELAYRQADQDDSVAIELAEYYKSIGNYSKAEYTLSKAIEDGGSIDLYIALCKTFVEQDKLRDAVLMLDHVASPEIKHQLHEMRPKAPAASYVSGSYTNYITVELKSGDATVYAATDLDYPSIETDRFDGACTLPRGATTFYAVAVAENGLVSPMAEYHYTIEGVVEEVIFTDMAFEDAVRQQLDVEAGTPIFSDTLWEITSFQVPSAAASCEDLIWMPNLTELTITGASFSDLQVIEKMGKLQTLTIQDTVISANDLSSIAKLPALERLTLSGCYLSSITNLAGATGLTYLDLSRNSIRDISPLAECKQLTYLDMSQNALISLEAIAGLTELRTLDVSYNSLVSTAHVGNLVNLTKLDISGNLLMNSEIVEIEKLTELTWFAAAYNNLFHIDFLKDCTKLETLLLSNNTLLSLDPLSDHIHLDYLDFSYNEVEKLPAFSKDCALSIISGGHNHLTSLDELAVLQKLEYVYMDYNKKLKKIDALVSCGKLKQVNVYGTSVSSARKLIDKGIIVNYNPL